jgi:cell division protein FtsB
MPSTQRAAWMDAWEGASTPSPFGQRGPVREPGARSARYRAPSVARSRCAGPWDAEFSVARISLVREEHGHRGSADQRGGGSRRAYAEAGGSRPAWGSLERLVVPEVAPIRDYDWDAAARRRPAQNQCERVILHADREIDARMSSTRYYGTEATARQPEPWAEAERRAAAPRLRVVKHRTPRRWLGTLAVVFAVGLVGLTVVAPMMMSTKVAGVEAAVGQAEAQQQQLAADTAALAAQISSLSSPQRVAEEAAQLGLVPSQDVSYQSSGGPMLASDGETAVAGR